MSSIPPGHQKISLGHRKLELDDMLGRHRPLPVSVFAFVCFDMQKRGERGQFRVFLRGL